MNIYVQPELVSAFDDVSSVKDGGSYDLKVGFNIQHVIEPLGLDPCELDDAQCAGFTFTAFDAAGCHARWAVVEDGHIWVDCGNETIFPTSTTASYWDRARISYTYVAGS